MTFPGWSSRACRSTSIVLALLLCVEASAHAESPEQSADEIANPDRQRAADLYEEGTLLLGAGRYWEAELRFQESYKLLKGRGTLLNLAICHENLGRLASAWHELKSLEEQASVADDSARLKAVREHLEWIEPQLSYLSVNLSPEAQGSAVQAELDGEPVSTFGVMFPIDPGRHQLRASAPGKKVWSTELVSQNGNQRQNVTIPSLQDLDVLPVVPQASSTAALALAQKPQQPPTPAEYTGVYIAGAATLTLTVGAVVSAFLYYDRRAAYHDAITNPGSVSDAEASARRESAQQMAWINGSLIVSAGVGAAVTGILWYRTSRANTKLAKGAWVAPLVVGSGAGLRVGASF